MPLYPYSWTHNHTHGSVLILICTNNHTDGLMLIPMALYSYFDLLRDSLIPICTHNHTHGLITHTCTSDLVIIPILMILYYILLQQVLELLVHCQMNLCQPLVSHISQKSVPVIHKHIYRWVELSRHRDLSGMCQLLALKWGTCSQPWAEVWREQTRGTRDDSVKMLVDICNEW